MLRLVAILLSVSSPAFAAWELTKIETPTLDQCGGEGKYDIALGEFNHAWIWKNGKMTVTLCSAVSPKDGYLSEEWMLKYQPTPKSKFRVVTMESAMMAWGLGLERTGDRLSFQLYWPSDPKTRRKVRTVVFACEKDCRVLRQCKLETLATDLPKEALFEKVRAASSTLKKRVAFVEGAKNALALDQLFIRALSRDEEAVTLIEGLGAGLDAGPGEVMSTYSSWLTRHKDLRCKW